jgi:hypothetical protein
MKIINMDKIGAVRFEEAIETFFTPDSPFALEETQYVVYYHADADGFCSAYNLTAFIEDANYIPINRCNGDEESALDSTPTFDGLLTNTVCVFLDYMPSESFIQALEDMECSEIVIIDHHGDNAVPKSHLISTLFLSSCATCIATSPTVDPDAHIMLIGRRDVGECYSPECSENARASMELVHVAFMHVCGKHCLVGRAWRSNEIILAYNRFAKFCDSGSAEGLYAQFMDEVIQAQNLAIVTAYDNSIVMVEDLATGVDKSVLLNAILKKFPGKTVCAIVGERRHEAIISIRSNSLSKYTASDIISAVGNGGGHMHAGVAYFNGSEQSFIEQFK